MSKFPQKVVICNNYSSFITLMLEPWGEDYGMFPDDKLEVIAADCTSVFYFHIQFSENYVTVWAEGDNTYPMVLQNGKLLSCGHNRQKETDQADHL